MYIFCVGQLKNLAMGPLCLEYDKEEVEVGAQIGQKPNFYTVIICSKPDTKEKEPAQ